VPPSLSEGLGRDARRRKTRSTYGCCDAVFLNSKTKVKTARPGKNGKRWYKDVGLGFKTPKAAIDGTYIGT
jgi:hypothetical protein